MQKSNLINIFRTFSRKEFKDFRKWLLSPVHNQREDVIRLLDYCANENTINTDSLLEKEIIYNYVFPKQKYDDAKMRQVIYFITEAIEQFLVYQQFKEDEVRQQTVLAAIYSKRNLIKPFKKSISDYEQLKLKNPLTPDSQFLNDYFIQKEIFDFKNKHERSEQSNLTQVQNQLDAYYFINTLRLACAGEYYNRVFKAHYSTRLIEEISALKDDQLFQIPLLKIYFLVYQLIKFPESDEHFISLKAILSGDITFLSPADAKEVYLWAINFCSAKINSGRAEYNKEVFELYKKGISDGFLIEDKIITPFTFKNVISRGILLKEFSWVEKFIHDYQHYLDDESKKGIVDFNLAMLYHAKKEYKKSQQLLISLEVDDLLINLNARFLLIKIYVEQSEFELLEPQLDNMRAYLNRKELIGYHKNTYKNVISVLKKMLKIRSGDKIAKLKLQEEVKIMSPLVDKEWFIAQIALI
ncbi:MAG: tetratricopeptide repeat protein [Saprospiraceae bacterium]